MYSFAWPDFLGSTYTRLNLNHDATANNLKLLLLSGKTSLYGDPYFGTNIERLMFDQNNDILKDIVIDDIYTAISTFMPQLTLKRKDIEVIPNREQIYIKIKATNLLDFTTDLYTIKLTEPQENLYE